MKECRWLSIAQLFANWHRQMEYCIHVDTINSIERPRNVKNREFLMGNELIHPAWDDGTSRDPMIAGARPRHRVVEVFDVYSSPAISCQFMRPYLWFRNGGTDDPRRVPLLFPPCPWSRERDQMLICNTSYPYQRQTRCIGD